MENQGKGVFNDQLRDRTLKLAVRIHDILKDKKITILERSTVYQLIKSSTSVAANFRAATRARSDAEFYSKICIVVEECDETQFWLDFLIQIRIFTPKEMEEIIVDVNHLLRLFSSIKATMKRKINDNKGSGS